MPCDQGSYTFQDPMSPAVCTRCDAATMNCPGGSLGYPQWGYWRQSNRSDNVVKCPYQAACL